MKAAEAAMLEAIELTGLPRWRNNAWGEVRRTMQHPATAQFRDVHMNTAHNARAAKWTSSTGRMAARCVSGYRRFAIELVRYRNSGYDTDDGGEITCLSAIDIDYQDRHDRYNELSKKTDCTPDPRS